MVPVEIIKFSLRYLGLIDNLQSQLPSGLHLRNVETEQIPTFCLANGLEPIQQEICAENPATMLVVGNAARNSMTECSQQFRYNRWNCTFVPDPTQSRYDVFGNVIRGGNGHFYSSLAARTV